MIAAGRRGDVAAVLEAYDVGAEALARARGSWLGGRVRFAAVAIAVLARILPSLPSSAHRGVVEAARQRRESALASVLRPDGSTGWGREGAAWLARLEAETLRLRWLAGIDPPTQEELVRSWRDTEAAYTAFGHVYQLAVVRATLAGILRATGDLAGSRALADQARASAKQLGAQPLLDELQALGSSALRRSGPSEELTSREREILALVAQGRSNGEIGKQLYISAKTVSVHVSNILGKLGAAGRTEAAAIGRRRGLVD
jgi:DNA-binding CsgD family transcriptional regulator